jgi:hypothetical protein
MSKNSSFTQTQLFVLLGMATVIILILGAATFYLFVERETLIIVASPTNFMASPTDVIASSANIIASPTSLLLTETRIPTFVYLPTFTPIPSPTSFVVAPIKRATQKPQQVQNNSAPANNPPSVNSAPDCSAELDYANAMHKYYLDSIDSIYSPMINYYKNLIDEAIRNRDALGIEKAKSGLENEQAQAEADKAAENQRYEAERDNINANCQ